MAFLKTNLHLGPALIGAPWSAFRTPVRSQGALVEGNGPRQLFPWLEERQEKME